MHSRCFPWSGKETPKATRVLAAASCYATAKARRARSSVEVEEDLVTTSESLAHLARQLTSHGIAAEADFISGEVMRPSVELAKVTPELAADEWQRTDPPDSF